MKQTGNLAQFASWQTPESREVVAQALCLVLTLAFSILLLVGIIPVSPAPSALFLIPLLFLPLLWIALRRGFLPTLLATLLVDSTIIITFTWQPTLSIELAQTLYLLLIPTVCVLLLGHTITRKAAVTGGLQAERDRLNTIVQSTSVGILVFKADGACVLVNEAAAKIIGAPNVQAMMRNFYSIRAWREYGILEMVTEVLATGQTLRKEFQIVTTYGKEVWLDCQVAPLTADEQSHILFALEDISERVHAEKEVTQYRHHLEELVQERTAELQAANTQLQMMMQERERIEVALRESEEHFRLLAENSQDAIFRFDLAPQPHLIYVSPAVSQLTGYTPEEHYENPALWHELIAPRHREELNAYLSDTSIFETPIEFQWQRKDGTSLWFEQRYVPIYDECGKCVTVVVIARDITERRQIDEQLRKLSRAVEQSSVTVAITDAEGHIEYVNPYFTQVTGYTIEDIRGVSPKGLFDEKHLLDAQQMWRRLQSGKDWRGEIHNFSRSGKPYWLSGVVSPIFDSQGNVTHFLGVMEDVTQQKQQGREREAFLAITLAVRVANDSKEMLSIILKEITATFDATKTFYIAPDLLTGEMVVEAVYEKGIYSPITGIRIPPGKGVAALVYMTGEAYMSDDAVADPRFATPELLGGAHSVACVPLIAQGKTFGLLSVARVAPMTTNDVRLLVAIADMTATGLQRAAYHDETLRYAANLERAVAEQTRERREANIRLQELDQLKSKFVSDVSHELRTPVTNVGLYSRLIRRKPEKQEWYLDVLQEEAERLEILVQDILDLARLDNDPALAPAPLDLNDLLNGVINSHQAKADGRRITLSFHPDVNLPTLWADAPKLIQVATNLVTNAINYTPTGYVRVRTFMVPSDRVGFAVEDTGTGIYREDMPHLYERFYRGRRDQIANISGTGLGLSIVRELVELHQGTIDIDSEVGRGTIFTITLPIALPPVLPPGLPTSLTTT